MNKTAILAVLMCLGATSDTVKADTNQERMIWRNTRNKRNKRKS